MSPVEQVYRYNVYISYSSVDRPWAEKLLIGLERKGIEAFLDRSRLQPGTMWASNMLRASSSSQHIVVLWSKSAQQSEWVVRELTYFDTAIDHPIPGQGSSTRRIIFLLLDGEPTSTYGNFHMLTDLREAGVYDGSADQVDPNLWERVLDKVYYAISSGATIPLPLTVLTMTREWLDRLDSARKPPLADSLDTVLHSALGLEPRTI